MIPRRFFLLGAIPAMLLGQDFIPLRARSWTTTMPDAAPVFPIGKRVPASHPLGLPPVPVPDDTPLTEETIALGRKLFFDPVLSRDRTVSCASCHTPSTLLSDPRRVSTGVGGKPGARQSMTIVDAVYGFSLFWDGRALTLEEQASRPVADPDEMAHSLLGVERKLGADPEYVRLFAEAWGPGPIRWEMVAKSIASYERTLLSGNSPFDRYFYGGDKTAMNESAIRGLELFRMATLLGPNCVSCHRILPEHATFTEVRFHNTGVAWDPDDQSFRDVGHYAVTGDPKDLGAFKVPTLRNIALTAPYMHDGSMKTLEEVVDFYFEGGRPNPHLSGVMPHHGVPAIPPEQVPQAKADLVEFMKALTGDLPAGVHAAGGE
ncbi:MAG: cytochrome c peroxidase [Bryobacteraceae bacterium]